VTFVLFEGKRRFPVTSTYHGCHFFLLPVESPGAVSERVQGVSGVLSFSHDILRASRWPQGATLSSYSMGSPNPSVWTPS
jgi:hypothetical protein